MRWFRLHTEVLDDPKMQRLPGELFKALINLWCIASDNDGRLPDIDDLTFRLRYVTRDVTVTVLNDLEARGFIDIDEHGRYAHNWAERQRKVDDVAARMRKYRKGIKALENRGLQEKPALRNALHKCSVIEQTREEKKELEFESKDSNLVDLAKSVTPAYDEPFRNFWATYPKRDGSNPKAPAFKKFIAALKSGVELQTIMIGLRHYVTECRERKIVGTPYVAQAATWLHQCRWEAAQQSFPLIERPKPP